MSVIERPIGEEQATRLLAAIVESSEDAIVSKTLDGIITSISVSQMAILNIGEGRRRRGRD